MKNLKQIHTIIDSEIDPAYAKRARFIIDSVAQVKPKKILDIGCGRGYYVKLVSFFPFIKEINGIDRNEEYLKQAKKQLAWILELLLKKGSIYALPFKDNYFELLL